MSDKNRDFAAPAETCQCPACLEDGLHASDCAVHNAPAMMIVECDCRVSAPNHPPKPKVGGAP
jgi:hypothetical protein